MASSIPWSQNASQRQEQFAVAIQALVSELAAVKASSSSSAAAVQPKPVLPHLDKYTGDKKDLNTWIYAAEAKLHTNGLAIGDLEAQFHYLYSSLSPAVRRSVFAFAQVPANRTPALLLQKLKENFGEVNQDKKAGLELLTLKQRPREPISSFLIRFEELLYRAKANTWPDQALINSLLASLNDEWLKRLREKPEYPDSYSDLCSYLRKLDGNTFLGGSSGQGSSSHSPGPAAYRGEPMDIAATRVAPSESRKKKMRKQNAYFNCGEPSHWSQECPNLGGSNHSKGGSSNQKKVQIRYVRIAEPVGGPEDDDEGDDYNKEDY